MRTHEQYRQDVAQYIKQNKGEDICLLLSSQNALENCKRFAEKAGYTVSVAEAEYGYQLVMKA